MKSKKLEPMNDLVQAIGEHVKARELLARQAEQQYSLEVEAILKAQSRDPWRIEHLLDGILASCFDPPVLLLCNKLCRYHFKIDPEAIASYVHAYRDLWDEKVSEI
jgi:hypothetical protein